tara:strand:+ start:2882 stop:3121 length:240 start_codon:yes stop_codon:yes gene_type:complete
MFGILQKMDRFSNNLMSQDEKIDFIQEIVDNQMVCDMHQKYQDAARQLIADGKVVNLAIRRKVKNPERPTSPFWRSICY